MTAGNRRRLAGLAALSAACIALAIVLITGRGTYVVHARFANAGQLVKGAVVEVAGSKVGSVRAIRLTDDGFADVELGITDDAYRPLRRGTRASIRAVGQAGLNNRYVNLTPPPVAGAAIPNGGTLGLTETTGIVDLDALLSMFDARTRADLQGLIRHSGEAFAGSGAASFNGLVRQAAPALDQVARLAGDLNGDKARLDRLIATAGTTADALAERPGAIRDAIVNTGRVFRAVNTQRAAFADDIERLGGVLESARGTLTRLTATLPAVRADLRRLPGAARPLASLLRAVPPASRAVQPAARELRALLPSLNRSLDGLPPLARAGVPALRQIGPAMRSAIPILAALRVYMPDLILGVFGGLGGISASSYDASGHYGRLLIAASPQASGAGFASAFGLPELPGFKLRTGLTAPCPGAAAPPAPDGSNVWVPDPKLCDPNDAQR